jgi:hypothetical protein
MHQTAISMCSTPCIMRLCRPSGLSTPPNLEAIKENVIHDIIYDEHGIDNSLLDIYYPRNAQGALLPVVIGYMEAASFQAVKKERKYME